MGVESLEGKFFNVIEELEPLKTPSREIDIKISHLMGELRKKDPSVDKLLFSGWLHETGDQTEQFLINAMSAAWYTSSFDAAISLIEEGDLLDVLQRAKLRLIDSPVTKGYKERLIKYIVIEALKTLTFNRLSVSLRSEA